ncbi:MAG TPA: hypothetical protein VJ812_05955 [Gemmatimonadaceae bacterium]|jgi:hypothetical protein|nr:hypothetical protein [Gemmatimonadaceae bacterium]
MQDDLTPAHPALDEETSQVLLDALRHLAREKDHAGGLNAALRLVAAEGRRKNIRIEQLLVVLKTTWESLPEVRRAHWAAPEHQQLQQVITAFIDQYYAE